MKLVRNLLPGFLHDLDQLLGLAPVAAFDDRDGYAAAAGTAGAADTMNVL